MESKHYCPKCHVFVHPDDARVENGQRWHKHHFTEARKEAEQNGNTKGRTVKEVIVTSLAKASQQFM